MNELEYNSRTQFTYFYDGDVRDACFRTNGHTWLTSRTRKTDIEYMCGNYGKTCNFVPITISDAYNHIYAKQATPCVKPNTLTINKGDKIFFANSKFPSLLLGRLDVDLKRTTKPDTADKIVSDCNLTKQDVFHNVMLIDPVKQALTRVSWYTSSETLNTFTSYINEAVKMFSTMGYNMQLYVCISKQAYDTYQTLQTYSAKIISTKDFATYIVSQLPQLQQNEIDNISYMLKSQDQATVSTALGTLQYYNFAEYIPQILEALIATQCYELPNNRDAVYIYSLFNLDRGDLYNMRNCSIKRQIQFFMDCLNKFVVSPSMTVKQKVYTSLRSLLYDKINNEYKDELKRLDVSLFLTPNDENRTTDSSAETVEGA